MASIKLDVNGHGNSSLGLTLRGPFLSEIIIVFSRVDSGELKSYGSDCAGCFIFIFMLIKEKRVNCFFLHNSFIENKNKFNQANGYFKSWMIKTELARQ